VIWYVIGNHHSVTLTPPVVGGGNLPVSYCPYPNPNSDGALRDHLTHANILPLEKDPEFYFYGEKKSLRSQILREEQISFEPEWPSSETLLGTYVDQKVWLRMMCKYCLELDRLTLN